MHKLDTIALYSAAIGIVCGIAAFVSVLFVTHKISLILFTIAVVSLIIAVITTEIIENKRYRNGK